MNRQCQTDKDWVGGYWAYQRNECPVGAPTIQQNTTQPVTPTTAQVDNCCFTGWQCHTDDDWVRGYWAYQNNQCDAGSQVDNCCFTGWQCSTDDEWLRGYWAYKYNECAAGPTRSVGPTRSASARVGNIVIEGSETFRIWVNAGLDLLRRRAPRWYDYVQGATRKIKELPAGTGAGVYVEIARHDTAWDPNHYPNHLNIFTIAHEMVHEACHIYQYRRGDSREAVHQEKECLEKEIELFPLIDREGRYAYRLESWRHTAANMLHDPSLWWW